MLGNRFQKTFLILLVVGISVLFLSMIQAFILTILLAREMLQCCPAFFMRRCRTCR